VLRHRVKNETNFEGYQEFRYPFFVFTRHVGAPASFVQSGANDELTIPIVGAGRYTRHHLNNTMGESLELRQSSPLRVYNSKFFLECQLAPLASWHLQIRLKGSAGTDYSIVISAQADLLSPLEADP
jgi:hypothetical protein